MRGKSPSTRVIVSLIIALCGLGLVFGLASANGFLIYFPFVAKDGPTATPATTPTVARDCVPNRASAFYSSVSVPSANNPAWADNEMLIQVLVTLRDECNIAISDGRAVMLKSSRNVTTTVDYIAAGPINNDLYVFYVRSGTVGTSQFTAIVGRDSDADPITIMFPLSSPPTGNFVCVSGQPDVSVNPNGLQILYTNPAQPSLNRRLVYLTVEWIGAGSPPPNLRVAMISFGPSTNVIWQVGGGSPLPLTINPADWSAFALNRVIFTGNLRPLEIVFNRSVIGVPGPYRVTTGWDNTAGGSLCYSSPVNVP